ncbi:hypothetical protein E2320_000641 [Naja naja]|nr:hypothetical protein E2320_000641 [Naja naja]
MEDVNDLVWNGCQLSLLVGFASWIVNPDLHIYGQIYCRPLRHDCHVHFLRKGCFHQQIWMVVLLIYYMRVQQQQHGRNMTQSWEMTSEAALEFSGKKTQTHLCCISDFPLFHITPLKICFLVIRIFVF